MERKKRNGLIAVILFILVLVAVIDFTADDSLEEEAVAETVQSSSEEVTTESTEIAQTILAEVHLENVPLIDQLSEPSLYNGCEVTSLAMLLNYYGIEVTKNQLADEIVTVDYQNEDGTYGDPNEGFVGDVTGNNGGGYFVYHEPIFDLANSYATEDLTAVDLTGSDFSDVQAYLSAGSPIWVITTTTFTATDDLETWEAENGSVEISMSEHSVLLIGYDDEYVYLNDPYGNENYQTSLTDFVESWEQMGSQAITITAA